MCQTACPFAAAMFGSISGSTTGAVVGAVSGWVLHSAYVWSGGEDPQGLAFLVFGTIGTGIGGSGGAVGGMVEGWGLAGGKGTADGSAARWGAILGVLWGLQPILWLVSRVEVGSRWTYGFETILVVAGLGTVAALLGCLTSRQMLRTFGMVRPPAIPMGRRV